MHWIAKRIFVGLALLSASIIASANDTERPVSILLSATASSVVATSPDPSIDRIDFAIRTTGADPLHWNGAQLVSGFVLLKAGYTKNGNWILSLNPSLPPGSYIASSSAVNASGLRQDGPFTHTYFTVFEVTARPESDITRVTANDITVKATDPQGVARVDIAIRTDNANPQYWNGSQFSPGYKLHTATRIDSEDWKLQLKSVLPVGRYVVTSSAVNTNGLRQEMPFTNRAVTISDDADCIVDAIGNADTVCSESLAMENHVLNRLGFGPTQKSREKLRNIGLRSYIEEQLSAVEQPLFGKHCSGRCTIWEARKRKLIRAVASDNTQLLEVLEDFWFNHFNVDTTGGARALDRSRYESEAIRGNILGNFEDMLTAVAKSPAMLDYLNNSSSRVGMINENYARELLELHTVGVNGGYDDTSSIADGSDDVINVARILTGWRMISSGSGGTLQYDYQYNDALHDHGIIPAVSINASSFDPQSYSGELQGQNLLQFLARLEPTARFVSTKLVHRFVDEDALPNHPLVQGAVNVWLSTGGHLPSVYKEILLSSAFVDLNNAKTKLKSPHHLVASAIRSLNLSGDLNNIVAMPYAVLKMGQASYEIAPPTGYPEESDYWISSASMLARFNWLKVIMRKPEVVNSIQIASDNAVEQFNDVMDQLSLPSIGEMTRDAIVKHVAAMPGDLAQRKADILTLIFSSPEFMRH